MIGLLILFGTALTLILVIFTGIIVWEARRPPRHTAGYAVAKGLACDPGDLGGALSEIDYEEWTLDLEHGVRIPVWELSPSAKEDTTGLTAILIHGWGHSRIDMLSRVDYFAEFCDRIVLYDLQGHGEMEDSLSPLGSGEHLDLLALIERLDAKRVLLVGHSMGAVIAISAGAVDEKASKRIAGIIAYGVYTDFHASVRSRLLASHYPTRPFTDLAMMWFRLIGLKQRDLLADAARLDCPLLVIHGTEDEMVPQEQAQSVVEASSKGTLLLVEGAGHHNSHDFDPDRHREVVGGFVAGITRLD